VRQSDTDVRPWRFYLIIGLLIVASLALVARMLQLTVVDRAFLQKQGNARTLRTIHIPAYRGMITDRNGYPLAISTPVNSVWINPQEFDANQANLHKIAKLLHENPTTIMKRLQNNTGREFVYLKRHIDPAIGAQIEALQIPGVHLQAEFRRFYPEGESAAHVVGFTNIDDVGQEGLELAYDDWLRGVPGKELVLKDRYGHVVDIVDVKRKAKPGDQLTLSLDHRIQYLAYRELKQTVQDNQAKSGSIVVLDVKTGEVLGMANYPSYNPNQRYKRRNDNFRNRAVTDVFEPGSTLKAFSVANAIASGKYTPTSKVSTSPGYYKIGHRTVRDGRDNGTLDLTGILQHSSNVGMSKVTLSLAPESLGNLLESMGFGTRTDSGFPGEAAGSLPMDGKQDPFSLATLSFGYSLSVTTLQLAEGYAELASGGVKHPVSLVKLDGAPESERILPHQVANQVLQMLETVVQPGGTGTRGQVPGYRVLGKTGTTRIVGPNGYEADHHNALFVGAAPASDPRIVIAVVVRDPTGGKFYGGLVAAPVFANVMSGSLRLLDVAPDKA